MVTRLEGTPSEVAAKVSAILGDKMIASNAHAVAVLTIEGTISDNIPESPSDDVFQQLMAEASADAVSVGHMDDSREAMYSRFDGE